MHAVKWAALAVLAACGASAATTPISSERRTDRKEKQGTLKNLEKPGLEIGIFPLSSKNPIVDGDTVRVQGLENTLRLLGIDTEETFKHEAEKRAYEAGWDDYLKDQRGNSIHPVKMATPL